DDALDHVLRASAADDILDVAAPGLFDGFQHADQHVVVLRPDHVDLRIFGQIVLHDPERVVAVPVAVLTVEDLHIGTFDPLVEAILALLVDRDRQTADDDDFGIRRGFGNVFAGHFAERRVVAGDIEVADGIVVVRRRAVDERDEGARILDLPDGVDERIRIGRQDDQRVDALHGKVLHGIRLAGRIRRGLDDDVEARMLFHQELGDTFGVIDHAGRPAVVGGGDGHADRGLLLLLGPAEAGADGNGSGKCGGGQAESSSTHVFSPKYGSLFRPGATHSPAGSHDRRDSERCTSMAMMMMAPWMAPIRYSLMKFDSSMILPTISRMKAPQIVPHMRPTPPRSAVPPTTTAVIACSSHRMPVVAEVEPRRGT